MTELLLIVAVLALIGLNGFFVAAEFALVRARQSRVEQMAEEGVRGASLALRQIERIDEYLSACQVGITMASIAIGFLGEPAIGRLLEDAFGSGVPHWLSTTVSVTLAYLIVTSLHITAGEQVPKLYSVTHAEGTVRRTARGLELFRSLFNPFIWAVNSASNWMLRRLGVDPQAGVEEVSSADDLKLIIARGVHGGALDPGEAVMLSGVFHLHEQEARQVMTPIPAVVTVDISENVETAVRRSLQSGHTRLLVTEEENTDRVRGIVHLNALVRLMMTEGPEAPIAPAVKDALIVPETKPLDDLLADLQRERTELAVVVDEYGRTVGIVTVEDIIEEIVGEIADETDPAGGSVRRLANGDWYVRGHVPITDLADYGLELPSGSDAYNSVGGFVFAELGRLPKRGDVVQANGYSLRVESVRENRVEAVRIRDDEPNSRRRENGQAGPRDERGAADDAERQSVRDRE
jgi:CBS domain containing-hemolysin-like protein